MALILLGLGKPSAGPGEVPEGMQFVAVPAGVTLHVCSDEGWGLGYGPGQPGIWEQLCRPRKTSGACQVANGLALRGGWELHDERLLRHGDFAGHTVVAAGGAGPDPLLLCDGRPDTCPTSPAQLALGWTHDCTGVLGRAGLSGDVFLISAFFTHSFEDPGPTAACPPPGGAGCDGPGGSARWTPDAAALAEIAEVNRVVLGRAPEPRTGALPRERLFCMAGGGLFLVSRDTDFSNHDPVHTGWVMRHSGYADLGKLFLDHGAGRDGVISISYFGELPERQAELIKRSVESLSDLQVMFM
ncbi:hypothetical protein [Streptomyces sp. NPDC001594]|uniref:hypothetical protein n=1 Tax=Streptomyces sp. NPDC001594 TaxID=3364590 RepID=UPI0036B86F2E